MSQGGRAVLGSVAEVKVKYLTHMRNLVENGQKKTDTLAICEVSALEVPDWLQSPPGHY
jgi:hypothetical protein